MNAEASTSTKSCVCMHMYVYWRSEADSFMLSVLRAISVYSFSRSSENQGGQRGGPVTAAPLFAARCGATTSFALF